MKFPSVSPSAYVAEHAMGRITFRELAVDFFGSLVPGMVFILATTATLAWSLTALLLAVTLGLDPRYNSLGVVGAISQIRQVLDPFNLEMFVLVVLLSYMIGHTFYRQDPKEADRRSFERLYPHKRKEVARWPWIEVLRPKKWRPRFLKALVMRLPAKLPEDKQAALDEDLEKWVAQDWDGCEFPYNSLYTYLERRGLRHLLSLVTWGKHNADLEQMQRSKNFINILKIRLNFYFPEKCGAISRNEAHVRLMSSTWYMARKLKLPAFAALVVSFVAIWVAVEHGFALSQPTLFGFIAGSGLFALVIIMAASLAVLSIEKFLHYQRVREVVWVLETAYTAFRDRPELLSDICPKFPGPVKKQVIPAAATGSKVV
jgi:hypothetical protein